MRVYIVEYKVLYEHGVICGVFSNKQRALEYVKDNEDKDRPDTFWTVASTLVDGDGSMVYED
jgi:hypothetical protein